MKLEWCGVGLIGERMAGAWVRYGNWARSASTLVTLVLGGSAGLLAQSVPPAHETLVVTAPPTRGPERKIEAVDAGVDSDGLERFQQIYRSRKRPRAVVYLNRELSAQVRQWVGTVERQIVEGNRSDSSRSSVVAGGITPEGPTSGGATMTTSSGGKSKESSTSWTEAATSDVAGARESPEERWMWAFEEGFVQALLAEKVRVVDRTLILRRTAVKKGETGSLPRLEMEALKDHAEILIELLITVDPDSPLGYSFRASAKDLTTGELMVNGTLMGWSGKTGYRVRKKAVVTDRGYETVPDVFPAVREVAGSLARGVLLSLEEYWGP